LNSFPTLILRLAELRSSGLFRQNGIMFAGGLTAGAGSFVYHAIAGRMLGPRDYGQVTFLISAYSIAATLALVISVVLARYAASLQNSGPAAIGALLGRALRVTLVLAAAGALAISAIASWMAAFGHLSSRIAVLLLAVTVAAAWLTAVPRGLLQGFQRFAALALNLGLEAVVRAGALVTLLLAGQAVVGAVGALLAGLALGFVLGIHSLRVKSKQMLLPAPPNKLFSSIIPVAAGIVGVQFLFNQDVLLSKHYLDSHAAGIYGALNKIATIIYFSTLSVSQVLLPRVVAASASGKHPVRLLLISVAILGGLGMSGLVVFDLAPGLVVGLLYGPGFREAVPYVLAVGTIGLLLALNNLFVQFCIALHDRRFVAVLAAGCIAELLLIVYFHGTVAQIINDVIASLLALLVVLAPYSLRLSVRPFRVDGDEAVAEVPAEPAI
jgi:O-antigen/teichoic acid export membrane protein